MKRLLCVDALRGFDMLWIIGGGDSVLALAHAYPSPFTMELARHFDHAWGQFHFYDIIMPLFLFIVGVVMPVAFTKRLKRGDTKKQIYTHLLKRVFTLYILGLITSGHLLELDLSTLRLWAGTLHAIAAGYLVSAVFVLELNRAWQIISTAILLLLYWIIMAFVPVPHYGAGIFEENLNLALYIDDQLLGHFQEGMGWTYVLSNMTFVCSVMMGVFAGYILLSDRNELSKLVLLTLAGLGCLTIGKIWGYWFPIIHHLWTSSLVLFAGGWCFLLLALFFLIIDIRGHKKWSFPFIVIGANSIAVYVTTQLFDFKKVAVVFTGGLARASGSWGIFVMQLSALAIIWLILYGLYRKNIFIKI